MRIRRRRRALVLRPPLLVEGSELGRIWERLRGRSLLPSRANWLRFLVKRMGEAARMGSWVVDEEDSVGVASHLRCCCVRARLLDGAWEVAMALLKPVRSSGVSMIAVEEAISCPAALNAAPKSRGRCCVRRRR